MATESRIRESDIKELKNDPIKFIEKYLNVELCQYQKDFINKLEKSRTTHCAIHFPRISGKKFIYEAYQKYIKEMLNDNSTL